MSPPCDDARSLSRAHRETCRECRAAYAAAVDATARLGRERREVRMALERHGRRGRLRALAFGAPARGVRLGALRTLLGPALLLALVAQSALPPAPPGEVAVTRAIGRVRVGEAELGAGSCPAPAGAWCRTGESSRARVAAPFATLTLEPSSALLVERAVPLTVRLAAGGVRVSGTARVVSAAGAVEVREGGARIALVDGDLRVGGLAGTVVRRGPEGRRSIPVRPVRSTAAD